MTTGQTRQVTFTPNIIESDSVWISDEQLAFVMPQYPFVDSHHSFPDDSTVLNSKIGVGLLNIDTGEIIVLSDKDEKIRFFSEYQALMVGDNFYDSVGNRRDDIPPIPEGDIVFDTKPISGTAHGNYG